MKDTERQDNDMDDVAWLNLFIQLTGGFSDVVTENRSRTDLTPETVDGHLSLTPSTGAKFKRKSVDEKPLAPTQARKHFISLSQHFLQCSFYMTDVRNMSQCLRLPHIDG